MPLPRRRFDPVPTTAWLLLRSPGQALRRPRARRTGRLCAAEASSCSSQKAVLSRGVPSVPCASPSQLTNNKCMMLLQLTDPAGADLPSEGVRPRGSAAARRTPGLRR